MGLKKVRGVNFGEGDQAGESGQDNVDEVVMKRQ